MRPQLSSTLLLSDIQIQILFSIVRARARPLLTILHVRCYRPQDHVDDATPRSWNSSERVDERRAPSIVCFAAPRAFHR